MRYFTKHKMHLFLLLFFMFTVVIFYSCEKNNQLVSPFNSAKIELQLVFPDSPQNTFANYEKNNGMNLTGKNSVLNSSSNTYALLSFDDVNVSVLDSTTGNVVIKQQKLTVSNNVAAGELSIPIVGDEQIFTIIVFASDRQELLFLTGTTHIKLKSGELVEQPVFIILQQPFLIAQQGSVEASSTRTPGNFAATLAIDFNFSTSWFSAGSNNSSTFTWTGRQEQFYANVGIVNNSDHSDPSLQNGFGFEKVTFQVFDGANGSGDKLFEETVDYPKSSQVPVVNVAPLVSGRSIRLLLNEPEDPTGGGFSELLIVSDRAGEIPQGAILSNPVSTLLKTNDSTGCNIFSGQVGSLFEFSFDYNDPDGNVTEGTVVHVSWVSSPSGVTGSFDIPTPTITGSAFQGSITALTCWLFGGQDSFDVTISITDAGGQTSNEVTVNVPRPEGGNTAPPARVAEDVTKSKAYPDAGYCGQN